MTCALITGAQGFVGRYLTARLLASDPEVRIVGLGRSQACRTFTHAVTRQGTRILAPLAADIAYVPNDRRYLYARADMRDRRALRRILSEFRPDLIFHLASGLRDDAPSHLFRTSVEGTIDLLDAVCETGLDLRALVIGSSGSVYGLPAYLPISEDFPCEPRDFYAVSKLAEEHVSRIVARERRLPLVVGRIFNIVGPGQDERHVAGRFAAQIADIVAGSSPPRLSVGDLSTTRDFVDVRDVAGALIALARRGEPGSIYNVASGVETSVSRVLELLLQAAGRSDAVVTEETYVRPSDTPRVVADVTRLRALGYDSFIPLKESLSDLLEYYGAALPAAV